LRETTDEVETRLCGLVTKVEVRNTKETKKPWARVVLEDLSGSIEVMVFPDTYAALPRPISVGEVVVISGSLDRRDDAPKVKAVQVLSLPEAYEQLLQEIVLHLPVEDWADPSRWTGLRELVMDAPGPVKLRLICSRGPADGSNGGTERECLELAPADHYGVTWTPPFKTQMEKFLTGTRYELRANPAIARQKRRSWERRG